MTDSDTADRSWHFPDMVREGRAALRLPDHIELRHMFRPLERRVRLVRSILIGIALCGVLPPIAAAAFLFDPHATVHDKGVIAGIALVAAILLLSLPALLWSLVRFQLPPAWNPLAVPVDLPAPLREILDRAAGPDGPVYVCNWKPVDRRIFASPVGPLAFSDDAWGLPSGLYPLRPQPILTEEAMACELRWMRGCTGAGSSRGPAFSLPPAHVICAAAAAAIVIAAGWVSGLAAWLDAACGWPAYEAIAIGYPTLMCIVTGVGLMPGDLFDLLDDWIIDRRYRMFRNAFQAGGPGSRIR